MKQKERNVDRWKKDIRQYSSSSKENHLYCEARCWQHHAMRLLLLCLDRIFSQCRWDNDQFLMLRYFDTKSNGRIKKPEET